MSDLDTLRRLAYLEDTIGRLRKTDVAALRLPYAQRVVNPFPLTSSGGAAGDFSQATSVIILAFRVSVFVQTTNNGSNYWTIDLLNTAAAVLASVDTSAASASTWTRLSDTDITQPASSNAALAVRATATGSPGAIFIVPEVLVGT